MTTSSAPKAPSVIDMDGIFHYAWKRRRRYEFTLTSEKINAKHYGAPTYANKKSIWPPLSSDLEQDSPLNLAAALRSHENPDNDACNGTRNTANVNDKLPNLRQSPDKLYEPLLKGRTIRLLELEASREADPLRGRLLHVDLASTDLRFEALSYVWGSPEGNSSYLYRHKDTKPMIHLDGYELPMNVNLAKALRALRFQHVVRFIWVDAICINQDDARERGHQVTLMSSIYSKAMQVIVWLVEPPVFGLDGSDSQHHEDFQGERAFGAICDVVNYWLSTQPPNLKASYGIMAQCYKIQHVRVGNSMPDVMDFNGSEPAGQPENFKGGLSLECQEELNLAETPHWHALHLLFNRSWFWRLWVFQEIALARKAVARIGHVEIDWKWIGLAAAILRTQYHGICQRMKLGGVYNAYLMFRLSSQSDLPRIEIDFLRLLRLTRQFEVTDPRDRIYGLLGITTKDNKPDESRLLVQTDYTISTGELWKRLAVILLTSTDDLSLLSCVQYHTDKLESEQHRYIGDQEWGWRPEQDTVEVSVPSWVPQWNHSFRATISPWDTVEHFSAAKAMPRALGKSSTAETLVLQGIEIGVIGHGPAFMWHEADISLLQSEHLKNFFKTEVGLRMLATTLTAGRDSYGSILKHDSLVLADFAAYILSRKGRVKSSSSMYDARKPRGLRINDVATNLNSTFLEKLLIGGDATRFEDTALQYCDCRRLFLTMNGYLGLGPDTLREGDVLCVLGGGDVPYILRPLKAKNPFKIRHLLVGECFVDGLMDGEGVDSLVRGTTIVGPIPPDLVLQTILESIWQESQCSMTFAEAMFQKELNTIKQLPVAAQRENFKNAVKLPLPRKSWFEIC